MSSALARASRVAQGASPARIADAPPLRRFEVCMTDFAPRLAFTPIDSPKRWATVVEADPLRFAQRLLKRLGRAPRDVRLETWGDDVAVLGDHETDVLPGWTDEDGARRSSEGRRAALAFVWRGIDRTELQALLDRLAAEGWRPDWLAAPIDFQELTKEAQP